MKLIQIPFSHNCVKVRLALELKGLPYDTEDIMPMNRDSVVAASGQGSVPALVDGETAVADSTAILRYLEQAYPEKSLLPADASQQAECWLLEDWADQAFMEMSRRIAYWRVLSTPGRLESMFFPEVSGLKKAIMSRVAKKAVSKRFRLSESRNKKDLAEAPRVAKIAMERLGGRPYLFGDRPTVADVSLATMAAPLIAAPEPTRSDPAVDALIEWAKPILGEKVVALYTP